MIELLKDGMMVHVMVGLMEYELGSLLGSLLV